MNGYGAKSIIFFHIEWRASKRKKPGISFEIRKSSACEGIHKIYISFSADLSRVGSICSVSAKLLNVTSAPS